MHNDFEWLEKFMNVLIKLRKQGFKQAEIVSLCVKSRLTECMELTELDLMVKNSELFAEWQKREGVK